MKPISIGKLRGLQQISSQYGTITALALDHRQNLRKANPIFVNDEELSRFKLEVVSALASEATAVLLDPEVSAAQAIARYAIPKEIGMVVALESTGYTGDAVARHAQIIPGWSVEKAKRMGASASEQKRYGVVETARRLTPLGADILKAEFPLDTTETDQNIWKDACEEISSASCVPWILLSAAVDYETYLRQVIVACNAGANGIAVGRALWQEAVSMSGLERNEFLKQRARQRLARLTSLCEALAKPYTDFYIADAPFDWYETY